MSTRAFDHDECNGDENDAGRIGDYEIPVSDGLADAYGGYGLIITPCVSHLLFLPEVFCEGRCRQCR
jgi:hypothetical protein